MKAKLIFKGGAGSGNFGHSGRPGKVGGSASGSGGSGGMNSIAGMVGGTYNKTGTQETVTMTGHPTSYGGATELELTRHEDYASDTVFATIKVPSSSGFERVSGEQFKLGDAKDLVRLGKYAAEVSKRMYVQPPTQNNPNGTYRMTRK